MNKKILVYGMHCKACEVLLENKISEIDGVIVKKVSSKDNYINLEIEDEKDIEKINKVIKELGYSTESKKVNRNNMLDNIIIFLIFIIFGMFFYLFKDIKLFEDVLKNDNLSFFIIFLIGIVASMSTCLAVTGGIIVGFSKYIDNTKNISSHLKIQLQFHFGRILGYAIGGGILGLVGGYIGSFGMLNKFLLLLAGVFMLYMGLNMLNIFPSITKLGVSMPKIFGNKILSIKNPVFAPIVGALTFFLPCGFTQSMQIYAASSSSFLSGAFIMAIFALGTMPILFLVGFGSSYFKDKNFTYINKIIGVLVVYFGIFILSGFANMFNINFQNTNNNIDNNITQDNKDLQELKEITVVHNGGGFENDVVLEGAKNYKLTINPSSDGKGCFYGLTIPGIDNNEYLIKKGIPITIDIKNPKTGTYKVVCTAMGMQEGKIIIK